MRSQAYPNDYSVLENEGYTTAFAYDIILEHDLMLILIVIVINFLVENAQDASCLIPEASYI